jgi:predicted nucleic acid-binding protein
VYLVDTNVLSAGSPAKATTPHDLVDWMDRNSDRLFLSVVTIAEIEDGIAKASREGAPRKAERLTEWLETLLHLYGARVIGIDLAIGRLIGRLSDRARGLGQAPGFADLAIAATAQSRNLVVLTRNLRHFATIDIPAHDPFAALP